METARFHRFQPDLELVIFFDFVIFLLIFTYDYGLACVLFLGLWFHGVYMRGIVYVYLGSRGKTA